MIRRRLGKTARRAASTSRVPNPPTLHSSTQRFGPRERKEQTGVPADHFVKQENVTATQLRKALKLVRAEQARRGLS